MRILYLDIDTLRPAHLSCYGYHRETSPNIDVVAKEGVRFEKFYASDTPCMPSKAALFTGRFGIHNRSQNGKYFIDESWYKYKSNRTCSREASLWLESRRDSFPAFILMDRQGCLSIIMFPQRISIIQKSI